MVKTIKQIIKFQKIKYNYESTNFDLSFKDKNKKIKKLKILTSNC